MSYKATTTIQPHVLKKYNVIQKVGQGAYGHVWKVEDKVTHQIYALKKIFDAFQHATDAQRTYRQVTVLQQLSHSNIIKLKQTIKAQNNRDLYMVMQFLEADLYQVICEGILKDVHRKYIVYQIAKALKYMHSGMILHRDLKPSNILINTQCTIKLCDFGLVRTLNNQDETQGVLTEGVATRWYRAPQVLLGSRNYSTPADIWSLGCVVYQLISGKPLFTGDSTISQLQKIIQFTGFPTEKDINNVDSEIAKVMIKSTQHLPHKMKQILQNIDEQFCDLLVRMLKFNPIDRITIDQILNHRLLQPFRKKDEEKVMDKPIKIPIDDNYKFTVQRYRDLVYGVKKYSLQRTRCPLNPISDLKKSSIQKLNKTQIKNQTSFKYIRTKDYLKQVGSEKSIIYKQNKNELQISTMMKSPSQTQFDPSKLLKKVAIKASTAYAAKNQKNLTGKYTSFLKKKKNEDLLKN